MQLGSLFHRRFTARGASPGTVVAPTEVVAPRAHVFVYDGETLEERDVPAEEVPALRPAPGRVTWLDVQGLGDGSLVTALGEARGLHALAVADVVNTGQRPKAEDHDETLFLVLRMLSERDGEVHWEQVSLFLLDGLVITFQETWGDCLDPLRDRLRKGNRRVRGATADYLVSQIVDAVVDGYFPVLESFGERLEELEIEVVERPSTDTLEAIYAVKRALLGFRRAAWPLRDALSSLQKHEALQLSDDALPYLRDTADHVMQVVDVIETYREVASSYVDVYLSSVSQRTNEVMRVLTVIATIFIPLTFVAGVYGMNFDPDVAGNMPELHWPYAYAAFWAVCLALAVTLLVAFRRMGWLGGRGR